MGADFIFDAIPACELTDARKLFLKSKLDAMTDDDFLEFENDYEEEDILEYINQYESLNVSREVGFLLLPGCNYGLHVTGGMSWGDDPTDVFRLMECLSGFFWDELQNWAIEDEKERLAKHYSNIAAYFNKT